MNLGDLANLGQIVGAIGVMITLVYLAIQIRGNTKVASAQARHAISEFVLRISIFRAEHADRLAKLESGAELTIGIVSFSVGVMSNFCCMPRPIFIITILGLMPDAHWRPYARYMTKYIQSPGFKEVWDDIGPGFSEDFARWVDGLLANLPHELSKTNEPGAA